LGLQQLSLATNIAHYQLDFLLVSLRGERNAPMQEAVAARPGLAAKRYEGRSTLSGGQQQTVAAAQEPVRFIRPPLPEFSGSLASVSVAGVLNAVAGLGADGTAIPMAQQLIEKALTGRVCAPTQGRIYLATSARKPGGRPVSSRPSQAREAGAYRYAELIKPFRKRCWRAEMLQLRAAAPPGLRRRAGPQASRTERSILA
jgi:hypothetical protein